MFPSQHHVHVPKMIVCIKIQLSTSESVWIFTWCFLVISSHHAAFCRASSSCWVEIRQLFSHVHKAKCVIILLEARWETSTSHHSYPAQNGRHCKEQDIFIQNTVARELRGRDGDDLKKWDLPKARTVNYGIETLRFRGPVVWNLIPDDIKASKDLESFKSSIENWKPQGCNCRLCKEFIPNLGYI